MRGLTAIYFTAHVLIVLIATIEDFWKYLTNLTYVVVMINYLLIVFAHAKNGDFSASFYGGYQQPDHRSLHRSPYNLYRPVTFLYEFSLHMSLTVAFAFWLIEIPALALKGSVFNWATS